MILKRLAILIVSIFVGAVGVPVLALFIEAIWYSMSGAGPNLPPDLKAVTVTVTGIMGMLWGVAVGLTLGDHV